ncbi:MAG: 3-keto-5-aminohexanoate cleavage protein [Clostridiales bacterium]|nr:3-keto-5-aminohexanoate cleavage protein [Clostridiales bacterium]
MGRKKVIITAAVVGTAHMESMSPYLPVKPEDIIRQAADACAAGAASIHIHGRDRKTGEPSSDIELIREVAGGIKEKCDAIICITTGGSQMMTVEERISVIPALKPELASCNAGSMNFVLSGLVSHLKPDDPKWEYDYLSATYNNVFTNTYYGMETYIRIMQENGTVPEFEIYDAGMINNVAYFRNKGILTAPIYLQFVMGIQGGIPASVDNLVFLRASAEKMLGDNFTWSVAAAGRNQLPLAAAAMAMGGNVRVGLEDNLYIRPHQLAESNAQQVKAAVTIAQTLGLEPATPDEAREILGLKGKNKVLY